MTGELISIVGIINTLQIKDLIAMITITIIVIIIIRLIIYWEINKINRDLRRLDEKINIYKRLAKIEERMKI
jgi:hypothetical protein